MLKIIKYLSYNKNKSKKNYIKCTKFKVSINFITNFYLLGIEKVLNFILIPKGQTGGQRDRDSFSSDSPDSDSKCMASPFVSKCMASPGGLINRNLPSMSKN
jgi:hypothetical protein